jgi:hypothetical protein
LTAAFHPFHCFSTVSISLPLNIRRKVDGSSGGAQASINVQSAIVCIRIGCKKESSISDFFGGTKSLQWYGGQCL